MTRRRADGQECDGDRARRVARWPRCRVFGAGLRGRLGAHEDVSHNHRTVSPGYDDRQLLDGRVSRVTDREGGQYYSRQWLSALDMRADWIVVTSWNEWLKNTQVEPSVRYGALYAHLTRLWSAHFRRQS